VIPLFRHRLSGTASKSEGAIAGLGGALASVAVGGLLRDSAGGGEPLMAIFPILIVVAVRWGLFPGIVMLAFGMLGAWYVYIGQPFSFEVAPEQAGSLLIAAVSGGLILGICKLLDHNITNLRTAHAAEATLTAQLRTRSSELEQALQEQERSRQAIEFSESQFRVSFEHAAVGKLQAEPHTGKIVRANQAFCDMLGYGADELVGIEGWRLTFPEDVEADQEAYRQVLEGKATRYIREKRYIRRDGTLVWARVSLVIVRSPADASPMLAVAVVENIDDQRRYQLALEQAKANLEQTLMERTEALRQRALLLREVYHRVKNNLQVVDGLIMLQARLIEDPDARAQLQQTRDRIFALGLVHHQLMGSEDLQTFDVSPFLTQLVDNLVASSVAKQVRIDVRADPIKVDLDFAIPLGLVVTELVTNALKHAFGGRPGRIMIGLEKDAAGTVTLRLSDDGMGMPKPSAGNGVAPSMGLGMKIIAGLLGQMRGELHREDTTGTDYRIVFQQGNDHERTQ
jgi:PAS domain S-box-containing protein